MLGFAVTVPGLRFFVHKEGQKVPPFVRIKCCRINHPLHFRVAEVTVCALVPLAGRGVGKDKDNLPESASKMLKASSESIRMKRYFRG